MRYSVHGFSQSKAIEYGLNNDDLLLLRWFVDFTGTNRLNFFIDKEDIYYWIVYDKLLQDLPILNLSKDRIKRKHFDKLCEKGILKHKHVKQGGSYSYYAIGENYLSLIAEEESTPHTVDSPYPTVDLPYPYGKNDGTNINLLDNNKEKNNNINIIIKKESFKKPTLEEVEQYCKERKNNINAQSFIDYYSSVGWVIGKNKPMKDWRACVRTWEKNNKKACDNSQLPKWFGKTNEEMESMSTQTTNENVEELNKFFEQFCEDINEENR